MHYTADLAFAETGRIGQDRQLQTELTDFYYPADITLGICSNDASKRPSSFTQVNVTLFETLVECCNYWYYWQVGGNCHLNVEILPASDGSTVTAATATTTPASDGSTVSAATSTTTEATSSATTPDDMPLFFYPQDLITGKCSNDASQRPSNFDSLGFTLFLTLEQCCQYWYGWQVNETCLLNTPASIVDSSGETDGSSPATFPVASPVALPGTPPEQSGGQFYLVENNCSANGVTGAKSFATLLECCTNISDFEARNTCCNGSVELPADQLKCLLEDAADPVQVEQFYLSNGECYSSLDGEIGGYTGMLYESRENCCYALESLEDRHSCLWNQSGSSLDRQPSPASAPSSSASQLARGSYLVAAVVCLHFQFM